MTKSYISNECCNVGYKFFFIYQLLSNPLNIDCKQKYEVQSHLTLKPQYLKSMALFHTELPHPLLNPAYS